MAEAVEEVGEEIAPGLEHGDAEEEDEDFYADQLRRQLASVFEKIEEGWGQSYRSQYQTRQYTRLRHCKVLDILPALILITSTQSLTDDPRLDRPKIVWVVEHIPQLLVLRPEHDEECYTANDGEEADKNVTPLQQEHCLDMLPHLDLCNCFTTLYRVQ